MALIRVAAPHVLYIRVETRDASQQRILANPTSVDLTLHQPNGTALAPIPLTPVSIGIWDVNWPLPVGAAQGTWTGYVLITDPIGESLTRSVSFEVVSPDP